jgi:solute carrier family 8 (sodium/calcium exchanger)
MLHPTKNEDGEIEEIGCADAVFHFLAIGWKVFFALTPPPHIGGGWVAFGVALSFIGIVTAIVGEVANLLGCVMGLKPAVTAITFVALGTSLPDTFASKQAA